MSSRNKRGAGGRDEERDRRARLAAARERARREEARRRLIRRTATAVGALVVVGGIVGGAIAIHDAGSSPAASSGAHTDSVRDIPATPLTTVKGARTAPPWAAPADASVRAEAAGLPMLSTEGSVEHIHAHLDVIVNGKPVRVPENVGIDQQAQAISPLHTHDTSGVIHIESPKKADFTLAQFMTEWNVALSGDRIGALTTGHDRQLHIYLNGRPWTGAPGAVPLTAHGEIAIVYGSASDTAKVKVPSSYHFPAGE